MPEFPRFESQVASQNAIRRINPPRVGGCSEHSMDFKRTEHSWTCYKKLRTDRTVLLKDLKFQLDTDEKSYFVELYIIYAIIKSSCNCNNKK